MKRFKILIFILLILGLALPFAEHAGISSVYADTLAAPTNFKAEVFQYYNKISWTNIETSTYYTTLVEKSTDQGPYIPMATLYKGIKTYYDYSVSNGHVYTYRAKIYYGSASSAYTHELETITLYPSSFVITRALHDQVDLEWSYPSLPLFRTPDYETIIEKRPNNETAWKQIAVLKGTETTYRDNFVISDFYYYYRIRTRYTNGSFSYYYPSDYGISTRTGYHLTSPLWGQAISSNQIRLEWETLQLNEGEAIIQRKNSAGDFVNLYTSGFTNTYVDTGLIPGRTYTYRLLFKSKNGTLSEYSDEISIITETVPIPSDINAIPVSSDRIVISWSYPYEVETGFEIWRKSVGGVWEILDTLPKNSETYTDASASNGHHYTYMIRGKRGDTAFSSFTRSISVFNEYPAAPKPLVYMAVQGLLTLYSADEVPSNTTLALEYRDGINSRWEDLKTSDKGTLIAHVSYSASTELFFRLRASRGGLNSYSPEFHFFGSSPEPVQNVKAPLIGYQRVFLSWADISLKEEGYNIYRTVNGKTELIGQVDRDCESFEDRSPARGSLTRYDIKGFNVTGESAASSITINIPNITAYKDITLSHFAHDAVYNLQGLDALDYSTSGYFFPENTVSLGQAARMVLRTFSIPYQQQGLFSFSDLNQNHAYYKDLMTAVSLGIVFPDSQYRIKPDKAITRGELLLLLNNALSYLDKPLSDYTSDNLKGFSDFYQISEDELHIAASFIGDGIISGKSGNRIGMADYASRAESAVIIYRTLKRYGVGL